MDSALTCPLYYSSVGGSPFTIQPNHENFPRNRAKKLGRWVGIAEHQGDALTYLILDDISGKVVVRSNVRSALDPDNPNLRAETPTAGPSPNYGEVKPSGKAILLSAAEEIPADDDPLRFVNRSDLKLPSFTPEELLGRTFIRETPDGQKMRAKIVRQLITLEDQVHEKLKFLVELGESEFDELITYHELCDIVERQEAPTNNDEAAFTPFHAIIDHQGPLKPNHPEYMGSKFNVLMQWEDGTESYEPLDIIRRDDGVTLAQYALDNE
jgi:hypothetical protein